MKKFTTFCLRYNVSDPFPVTEYLLPEPREQSALPVLKRVQMGISRARLGRQQPSRVRLPITEVLRQMKADLEQSGDPERTVIWAVCCVRFFGFFCLGELLLPSQDAFNPRLHLAWGDVAVDDACNPRMMRCHLK